MKAIVTGATGGLGRNLVAHLKKLGWQVVACGRNQTIGKQLDVPFRCFDLCNLQQVMQHFEPADVVFHCAALSSPWGKYSAFYQANVVATEHVLAAMAHHGIGKIVHISTPSLYFDFHDQLQVKEDYLPKTFVNHYAKTKYLAEQAVLASAVQSVILRPRAIFGEYDTVLMPRLERLARRGYLPLVKNRQVLVDLCYVGNIVHAMVLAAEKNLSKGATFNISNQQPLAIESVFQMALKTLGINVPLKPVPLKGLMVVASVMEALARLGVFKEPPLTRYSVGVVSYSQTLDVSRANTLLGYQPIYSIEQGLARYAQHRHH